MSIASSDIKQEIFKLKQERHAVILVHNYQKGEIHEIADFAGDSLELSRLASSVPAKVIIFCGVHFMAETAYILSPDKTVILPEATAGCPMADMVTAGELQKRKAELPGYTVVTYVNSSAAVKALSDVCCTSANAVKVVKSIDNNNILFVPDRFLGQYVQSKTGKNIVFWPGHCPVHAKIRRKHIIEQKAKYPDAVVIAHPECRPEVIELSDEVLSTSGMVRYVKNCNATNIIVATDASMLYRLQKEGPSKHYIAANPASKCADMQLTSLESVLSSLKNMTPEVKVAEDIRLKALQAVERMVALG